MLAEFIYVYLKIGYPKIQWDVIGHVSHSNCILLGFFPQFLWLDAPFFYIVIIQSLVYDSQQAHQSTAAINARLISSYAVGNPQTNTVRQVWESRRDMDWIRIFLCCFRWLFMGWSSHKNSAHYQWLVLWRCLKMFECTQSYSEISYL